MTIKELFNDYEAMCTNRYAYTDLTNEERKQQIIQEIEALVRKETIEEILTLEYKKYIAPAEIIEYAQSKGITL